MKAVLLAALPILILAPLAVNVPQAHALNLTVYHLNITLQINGFSARASIPLLDLDGDGIIHVDVSDSTLARVQTAFGTTTFDFPDTYTGAFSFFGLSATLTIQSADTFDLVYH